MICINEYISIHRISTKKIERIYHSHFLYLVFYFVQYFGRYAHDGIPLSNKNTPAPTPYKCLDETYKHEVEEMKPDNKAYILYDLKKLNKTKPKKQCQCILVGIRVID